MRRFQPALGSISPCISIATTLIGSCISVSGSCLLILWRKRFASSLARAGWLLYYLPVMTILGLSGLWEIIESWVTRAIHPELGIAYLGSQGDPWDAQKDMAAALYGALLCMTLLFISRKWRGPSSTSLLPTQRK